MSARRLRLDSDQRLSCAGVSAGGGGFLLSALFVGAALFLPACEDTPATPAPPPSPAPAPPPPPPAPPPLPDCSELANVEFLGRNDAAGTARGALTFQALDESEATLDFVRPYTIQVPDGGENLDIPGLLPTTGTFVSDLRFVQEEGCFQQTATLEWVADLEIRATAAGCGAVLVSCDSAGCAMLGPGELTVPRERAAAPIGGQQTLRVRCHQYSSAVLTHREDAERGRSARTAWNAGLRSAPLREARRTAYR